MKRLRTLLLSILLLTSCSSLKDAADHCIRSRETDSILPTLEATADSNAKAENVPITKTTTIEDTCHRQVYLRSGHRLLIFSTPNDPDTTVRGTLANMSKKIHTVECFTRARGELEALGRPAYHAVFTEHQKRWAYLWDDLEVGPVKWLNCGNVKRSI